ncbi:MAG TPA: DinB family protein [Candidatus Acidoferrales bacterium]|nr:DinB family protein [Candidatus Acidoferrales bacterium]
MERENILGAAFLKELEAEAPASRKCLERIPEKLFDWKPHEKSMTLGYLSLLVAEMPKWIEHTIDPGVIDFATWKHFEPGQTADLVNHFDENMKGARRALQNISDEKLSELFYLKNSGQVLMSLPKRDSIGSTINHLVHHRGQLTVFMRLNDIPVPSIYGPSADERRF